MSSIPSCGTKALRRQGTEGLTAARRSNSNRLLCIETTTGLPLSARSYTRGVFSVGGI